MKHENPIKKGKFLFKKKEVEILYWQTKIVNVK